MNMEEYFRAVETYVASHKLNLGDGGSVLSLLYEAYGDVNRIDDGQVKADFGELYRLLNGIPLQEMDWIVNPVCALCRDHERNGFVHGVQVGIRLAKEAQNSGCEWNRKMPRLTQGVEANFFVSCDLIFSATASNIVLVRIQFQEDSVEVLLLRDCLGREQLITG